MNSDKHTSAKLLFGWKETTVCKDGSLKVYCLKVSTFQNHECASFILVTLYTHFSKRKLFLSPVTLCKDCHVNSATQNLFKMTYQTTTNLPLK